MPRKPAQRAPLSLAAEGWQGHLLWPAEKAALAGWMAGLSSSSKDISDLELGWRSFFLSCSFLSLSSSGNAASLWLKPLRSKGQEIERGEEDEEDEAFAL